MSKRAKIAKLYDGPSPFPPHGDWETYKAWTSADVCKRVALLTAVQLRLRDIGYGEGTKDPAGCRAKMAAELVRTGVVMLRQRHRVDRGQHRIAFSVNGWTHDELIEKLGEAW